MAPSALAAAPLDGAITLPRAARAAAATLPAERREVRVTMAVWVSISSNALHRRALTLTLVLCRASRPDGDEEEEGSANEEGNEECE